MTTVSTDPLFSLVTPRGCSTSSVQTVFLANVEWQPDLLQGASLHLLANARDNAFTAENVCAADIQDGGFFDCAGAAAAKIILRKEGENKQLGAAEMRIYSTVNALAYAEEASSSTTERGKFAANLITQSPRTTSMDRQPTGLNRGQSCTMFSSFPAHATFDLKGSAMIENILVVGNAA